MKNNFFIAKETKRKEKKKFLLSTGQRRAHLNNTKRYINVILFWVYIGIYGADSLILLGMRKVQQNKAKSSEIKSSLFSAPDKPIWECSIFNLRLWWG